MPSRFSGVLWDNGSSSLVRRIGNVYTSIGGGSVPSSRQVNTTAPLAGGGDLSADRTLSINDFAGPGASGAVPDPGSSTGLFLRDDGSWASAGGGGGFTKGTATLNFGAAPGSTSATVNVTTGIGAGDMAWATLMYESSSNHNAEEHALLSQYIGLTAYRSALNTLTIEARSELRISGELTVRWGWTA